MRGLLAPAAARHAAGLQLRVLRAAGRADPVHQPGVRAQPRFHRRAGQRPHLARHGSLRHGLALERRRPAGGLAGHSALRAGGGRAELPGAHADAGADLGRPGSADDSQRQGAALVERHARRRSTGWGCTCAMAASCWRKPACDAQVRAQVLDALAQLAAPARTRRGRELLATGRRAEAPWIASRPRSCSSLARDLAAATRTGDDSCVLAELRQLAGSAPQEVNYAAISRAFGTPKPTLANSYEPELLNLRTFPTLMGYSSRIMAESWESNTLYWVALADELSLAPGATQRADSGVDPQAGGADFRLPPGRLAGRAEIAAPGGRRGALAQPCGAARRRVQGGSPVELPTGKRP